MYLQGCFLLLAIIMSNFGPHSKNQGNENSRH